MSLRLTAVIEDEQRMQVCESSRKMIGAVHKLYIVTKIFTILDKNFYK